MSHLVQTTKPAEESASEQMRRRMEAMALRDEQEAAKRREARVAAAAASKAVRKEQAPSDEEDDDTYARPTNDVDDDLADVLESLVPVAPDDSDRIYKASKKGTFSSQVNIPSTCIGAILGVKGARIRSIQSIPGVVELAYSKDSGILRFVAANKAIHDRVRALIEAYVDKSWPDRDQDEEEKEEEEGGDDESTAMVEVGGLKLYRKYVPVASSSVKSTLGKCRDLSSRTGITRVLAEPRDPKNPKRKITSFMVEGTSERSVAEVAAVLLA